jgi:hypothetical protein
MSAMVAVIAVVAMMGIVGGHAGPPLRTLKFIDTDALILRRTPAGRGVYLEHNREQR